VEAHRSPSAIQFSRRDGTFVVDVVTIVSPRDVMIRMTDMEGGCGCVLTTHMTRQSQEMCTTTRRYVCPLVMNISRVLAINNIKCVFVISSTSFSIREVDRLGAR
jgi:hypothetical protein